MTDTKFVIFCSAALKISVAAFITIAAVKFGRPGILWWYLLLPFIGWDIKFKHDPEQEEEDHE